MALILGEQWARVVTPLLDDQAVHHTPRGTLRKASEPLLMCHAWTGYSTLVINVFTAFLDIGRRHLGLVHLHYTATRAKGIERCAVSKSVRLRGRGHSRKAGWAFLSTILWCIWWKDSKIFKSCLLVRAFQRVSAGIFSPATCLYFLFTPRRRTFLWPSRHERLSALLRTKHRVLGGYLREGGWGRVWFFALDRQGEARDESRRLWQACPRMKGHPRLYF
jgi:hypothetical protein